MDCLKKVRKLSQSNKYSSVYSVLSVSPTNTKEVFVGGDSWVTNGVFKTKNGGLSWTHVLFRNSPKVNYGWLKNFNPVVKAMAISPKKPEFIVVGTSAHIFRSKDGGISWSQAYSVGARDGTIVGNGLENTCGLVVRFDPIDPKRCYFIYADVGLLKSENHGKSFEQIKISLTDIRITDIIVDPTDTKRIWICGKKHNGGFVYRSTDGGNTWNTKNHLFPGTIDNITLDHKSALYNRSIYVTSIEHGIYKSVDDGVSWLEANDGLPKSARKDVVSIQMHPDKTDTIRCLLGSSPIEGSGVYETKNGGQNWYRITENNAPFAMVRNLVIDPKNWDIMYVCQFNKWIGNKRFAGGLYKSLEEWEKLGALLLWL